MNSDTQPTEPAYNTDYDADTTDILDVLKYISKTERHEHVWKNGEYQGCTVAYANPLHPDLKTVFHPYIPLSISGQEMPKVTREYFLQHGWPVPGEESANG